jgi:hypothetical protein
MAAMAVTAEPVSPLRVEDDEQYVGRAHARMIADGRSRGQSIGGD